MLRIATATVLSAATLILLVVVAFLLGVFGKAGSGGDSVAGGLLLAMLGCIGGMWFAFAKRRHLIAVLVGAAPVALVIYFLATFQMRMF